MAMVVGQRREAMVALERAVTGARLRAQQTESSADAEVRDLMRRLEARRTAPLRCTLRVGAVSVSLFGSLPVTLGREADVCVRGTGVSRTHCRVSQGPSGFVLEDLGSSNGTLVRGVPLGAPLPLTGPLEVGLGDDVAIRIEPSEGALLIRVLSGLDSGSVAVVGPGALLLPGVAAHVRFEAGFGVLSGTPGGSIQLAGQRCMAPVDLLREDVLSVDGVRVEVTA